ncbi:U6 snRNA phosphodiesterase [Erysiphe neolycopersici]|uniref:U6 snRNA phosphodiesterase n=1 Tax=Erysiphe neolycopersici TaxID=212602 RepID=A0A420HZJ0_9PEZI|nr:U6 snRNA phosphodiesterase [Erysiphe neolycopersici]
MALVDYTSSDEDKDTDTRPSASPTYETKGAVPSIFNKANNTSDPLPPLPAKFYDLYASTKRLSTKDDPSLHGGRIRSSPHVVGNWPTHIYLEWNPTTIERELLHQLIMAVQSNDESFQIHSLLTSELKAPLPLHVSLSRPIQITTKQKESIIASVRQSIKCSSIQPFEISFTKMEWVSNFERSRWFLVLKTSSRHGNNELQKLLRISNTTIQRHGLLPLYENLNSFRDLTSCLENSSRAQGSSSDCRVENQMPISDSRLSFNTFHVSIAWSLEPPSQSHMEWMETTNDEIFENISKIHTVFENVKVKIGNAVISIPLLGNVIETGGSISI